MKQIALDLRNGKVIIEDVPVPRIEPNNILVRNYYSVISIGTELSLIKFAKKSLIGKAKERPDLFKKVLEKAKRDGFLTAYRQATRRLEKYLPLGYSCVGEVVKTGENIFDFEKGDIVACAGAEYANHAEFVVVPKNLCVKVPDNVNPKYAAFTTIGSIALQGIRNANIQLGNNVVVIGLGLIGLITVQLLKAAGCKVIGVDIDTRKLRKAKELGIDYIFNRDTDNLSEKIVSLTNGYGADVVIITAATKSNDPVVLAGKICREKGIVVIIGNVNLAIPREIYYEKELSLIVSRSYGAGRYDPIYELKGIDYPISYARWTIKRNMESFLELLKERKIDVQKIITHEVIITEAIKIYELIETSEDLFLGVLIKYTTPSIKRKITLKKSIPSSSAYIKKKQVNIGVIGAGVYATSVLLPLLAKIPQVSLIGLATATGISAKATAKKYKFEYCTTDYNEILNDKKIDAVIITTRNKLHAKLAIESLKAEKHVLVEKPLAITEEDIINILDVWKRYDKILMVGYNRRYAPYTSEIKQHFAKRIAPAIAFYRVNAEKITPTHWIYFEEEGGGRIISEACHFIDYIRYIIGSEILSIYTEPIKNVSLHDIMDNFSIILSFKDGSIGNVIYTTQGNSRLAKEFFEIHADRKSAILENYRKLKILRDTHTIKHKNHFSQDKGHLWELKYFINGILTGKFNEQETKIAFETAFSTIKAKQSLLTGDIIKISLY